MGLLDDAIREHLDLKRRRGDDPAEIARLEHEALGPVRREPEPAQEPEPPAPEPHADEPAGPAEQQPAPVAEAPEQPDPRHSDIVHQPTTEFRVEDHPDEDDLELFVDEEPDAAPAAGEPDESVLEETPDFLQETPEHDRLWFEQRPPRDFDFDD
jgi:hypothetical protein